jgi:uncharacterized protein (DUF302 family)
MSYYLARTIDADFDEAIRRVTDALAAQGFGILTEIDIKETMKKKLDLEFRRYRILGACNPPLAHRALEAEDKIGALLPCNVIVQEAGDGRVEVAAVDPVVSMSAVDSAALAGIAEEVRDKLRAVVESL